MAKSVRIIRAEGGTKERVVDVREERVPDIYRLADQMETEAQRQAVLDVWYYAHDLRAALLAVVDGADIKKPIHTKLR
jgi:hypothetical protein